MSKSNFTDPISLVEILKEAIQKEHESCDYYHKAASVAIKPTSKNMFRRLADMEKGHASELTKHLSDLEAQVHIDKAITSSF